MHIAYSAIANSSANQQQPGIHNETDNEMLLRYQAYQTTCDKYSREIAAIQKYIPGWVPRFR